MTYEYSKKTWMIMFVVELNNGKIATNESGDAIVRITLSTKPNKTLKYQHLQSRNQLLVLLETETSQEKFSNLIKEIDELHVEKELFLLEPLSNLIRNRAKKEGFTPYKFGKSPSIKKSIAKAVEVNTGVTNALEALLDGNA